MPKLYLFNLITFKLKKSVVEDLSKNRQPMPTFEVIYFITPTKDSITRVIEDFNKDRKYKYVHIYLTDSKLLCSIIKFMF